MRILTRYILKEFFFPLSYCLTGFIGIYLLFELFGSFSRLLEAKLPVREIIDYILGYLAPYFMWLAPAALMLATLYTMWNFCRHSEIVAMRASGISFITIVKPILFMAFVMAGAVAWINEEYVPMHSQWAKQLRVAHFKADKVLRSEGLVYRHAEANRVWTVKNQANEYCTELRDVTIITDYPSGARKSLLTAEKAEYLDGEWWLTDCVCHNYNELGEEIPSKTPDLDALKFRVFPELHERPSDILLQNRDWKYASSRSKLRFVRKHKDITNAYRRSCLYDAWVQILSPLACIVITLFAIPAGISSGRQSVFKGILGALGLFFSFYALTIFCMVLVDKDLLMPIVAAFLPHVVFTILGIRLFLKQR